MAYVNYCGLESSPYHALAEKYLPNGSCGVVSFGLAGGREAASTFMKELKLAAIETHVADARTCCLNPASSTHRQMNDEQLAAAGVPAELVRMSCGLESSEDLIADIAQALDKIYSSLRFLMHKQHPQTAYRKYAILIGTIFENCDRIKQRGKQIGSDGKGICLRGKLLK